MPSRQTKMRLDRQTRAALRPGWLRRQIELAVERRKRRPDWLRRIEDQEAAHAQR